MLLTITLFEQVSWWHQSEIQGAWFLMGVAGLTLMVLWSVLRRSIELMPQHIRIVLGWAWSLSIPVDTIAEVEPASDFDSLIHLRSWFVTSFKDSALVTRIQRTTVVINPESPTNFIQSVRSSVNPAAKGQRPC
jgi:hypothetical protein